MYIKIIADIKNFASRFSAKLGFQRLTLILEIHCRGLRGTQKKINYRDRSLWLPLHPF
jgi:hypothetical protein